VTPPARVEIYDTTLRDGAQLEGISLTVRRQAAHRRASSTGSASITSRPAGPARTPKTTKAFRTGPPPSCSSRPPPSSRSGRPGASRARWTPTTRSANSSKPGPSTVCIVGKCWTTTSSRRSAPPSTKAWPWSPTRWRSFADAGLEVFFDAEHFFDGYDHNPEFSLRVSKAPPSGARRASCCATPTGGSLPDRVEQTVARSSTTSAETSGSPSTPTTTPAPASPTPSPASEPAPSRSRARSTATASEPATANLTPSSRTWPSSSDRDHPPDRLERLTPVAHHVADS